jgi:hypothetical protein
VELYLHTFLIASVGGDGSRMDLTEISCEDVTWTELLQDRVILLEWVLSVLNVSDLWDLVVVGSSFKLWGSPSPRHGASPGYGWRKGLPGMEGSCECIT